jgi:hypothetical protein
MTERNQSTMVMPTVNHVMRVGRQVALWVLCGFAAFSYVGQNVFAAYYRAHNNDFHHLYLGAKLLRKGGNPYDVEQLLAARQFEGIRGLNPYVYLPFTGLVLSPLSLLSVSAASRVWFVANHLFLLASLGILIYLLPVRFRLEHVAFALLIAGFSVPFYRTLTAGQLNAALLLLFSVIWWAYHRRRPILTGSLLAFATLFKISPGILFLYFAWKRDWKIVGWGIAAAVVLLIISIGLVGTQVHLDFLPVLRQMSYGQSTWAELGRTYYVDPANQSFNSLFHHLFAENPYTTPLVQIEPSFANLLTLVASALFLTLVLVTTWPYRSVSTTEPAQHSLLHYSLFIFLSLFIPSLLWDHYLVVLFLPMFALYAELIGTQRVLPITLFIVSIALICVSVNFEHPAFRSGLGIFLMSTKLIAALVLFSLTLYFSLPSRIRPAASRIA